MYIVLSIFNCILSFTLELYGNPGYPRKIVQTFMDFLNHFIRDVYLGSLKNEILQILQKSNLDIPFDEIDDCFLRHSKIVDPFSSEHKRFNLLKTKGFFELEEFVIGETLTQKYIRNELRLVPKLMHGIHVPLRKTFKLFLEIPGILNQIINYINKLSNESHIISNILQADLWLRKYKNITDVLLLPFVIFYDDLEIGNPLGSQTGINKFGAVYATIACLPPNIASRLDSIIFSTLIYANDKKETNNKNIFFN